MPSDRAAIRLKIEPLDLDLAEKHVRIFSALKRFRDLCDDDCAIDFTVAEPLEACGLVISRKVTKADLAEPFAAERGIEKGGFLWELTAAGRRLCDAMEASRD